jgi:GT2 family glycosyltransferase
VEDGVQFVDLSLGNPVVKQKQRIVKKSGPKAVRYESTSGVSDVVKVIASQISDVSSTLETEGEWIVCDLGGTFVPTCMEMQLSLAGATEVTRFNAAEGLSLEAGDDCLLGSFAHRLYYDMLRRTTNFEFVRIRVKGQGVFKLIISAESDTQESPVFFETIVMDGDYVSTPLEMNTLIPNGSLVAHFRCLSGEGEIESIRWEGLVRKRFANTGDRIVAIRTFGNVASVRANLSAIMTRLNETHPAVLHRYLFVIYDATAANGDQPILGEDANGRIIELKGGNYGGGGNASALLSLIVRAGAETPHAISEVVLFDDDAHIDADSFIRHDGFVTARKPGHVSTSVVYSRNNPARIQEFGGVWGRFFSPENYRLEVTKNDDPRVFIPYLVRANRNVNTTFDTKYIGRHQDVDFSTFIFISFPFDLLKKAGVPLPFFLRNDDCEICLRMKEFGAKIVVNPNISAWHDSAHNVIGEFYAVLHSLIINVRFGGLSKPFVLRFFMDRLSCLSVTRNLPLLTAYVRLLELYQKGPGWMSVDEIYAVYGEIRRELAEIMTKDSINLPFEVVDVLKHKDKFDIVSLVDPLGGGQNGGPAVFVDPKEDAYYTFSSSNVDAKVEALLSSGLAVLAKLSADFDSICASWLQWQKEFDHYAFWDKLLGDADPRVVEARVYVPVAVEKRIRVVYRDVPTRLVDSEEAETVEEAATESPSGLPHDFDADRYYHLNPDVLAAGMDAAEHWLSHGRYENRNY